VCTYKLQDYLKEYSKLPLIKTGKDIVTFNEIREKSDVYFKELAILEGKRVAVVPFPSPETITLLCALIRLNSQIVLLSPFDPPSLIHNYVNEIQISVLFCEDKYLDKYKDIPIPVLPIKKIGDINPYCISGKRKINTYETGEKSTFVILTSGSSSSPKKVVLSLNNLLTNAHYSNKNLPFQQGDTWLLSLPLFHVSGLSIFFRSIESGGTVFIPPENIRWWEVSLPVGITHISVVSTVMKRLLNRERYFLGKNLKGILLGGGPIPEGIVYDCYNLGLPLYTTYGLTEMASQVTTSCSNDSLSHLLTSGKPLSPDTVKIDEEGGILVRGPCRFQGYLHENTLEQPFDNEGWFATQDIGSWTMDGYLKVLGRRDNVFICGGENIQPEVIENQIMSSGCVNRVIVVPMKNEEYGYIPVAFVEYSEGKTENDLKNYLRERISGIKIPRYFFSFPEEFEGKGIKISRKKLTEWLYKDKERTGM